MSSKFTIEEQTAGKLLVGNNSEPLVFSWTAQNKNIPLRPWSFGVQQRTQRTDYPGGLAATEQVLGWNYTPFTLQGRFTDKYNTPGYAVSEWKKLELLVQRGNPVRISFEDVTIEGIITSTNFDYRRDWDIGYSITVSPHIRSRGQAQTNKVLRDKAINAEQLNDDLQEIKGAVIDLLNTLQNGLALFIQDTAVSDIAANTNELIRLTTEVEEAIETRFLVNTQDEPGNTLLHLTSQFEAMSTVGWTMRNNLKGLRSDTALAYTNDASYVMQFDDWCKGTMEQAHKAVFTGDRNAKLLKQKARPNAKTLYRPLQGESMYDISNRFYGNPHSWRTIANVNELSEFELSGTEILIIPDVRT